MVLFEEKKMSEIINKIRKGVKDDDKPYDMVYQNCRKHCLPSGQNHQKSSLKECVFVNLALKI